MEGSGSIWERARTQRAVRRTRCARFLLVLAVLAASVSWAPAAHAVNGYFSGPTNIGTGGGPFGVAVGNFNGDVDPDLAVTSLEQEAISIHLGGAGASFSGPTHFSACCGPRGIVVGDFDGDLDQDLAAATGSEGNVQIHTGNGAGAFTGPFKFLTGAFPQDLAVGQFNADLDPDLAVVSGADNTVSVLFGSTGATFSAPTTIPVGDGPLSVAVADFNADLNPDIVTGDFFGGTISVMLGDGLGGFTAPITIGGVGSPQDIVTGDFNGDLDPDLALANFTGGVRVLLGTAAAGFTSPTTFTAGTTPGALTVGQFNGDTDPDLAVANMSSNNVSILLGSTGGSFAAPTPAHFGADQFPRAIASGDFNADADPDLVAPNANSDNLSILLGAVQPPQLSVNDVTHSEGNGPGTTTYTFTVTRFGLATGEADVHIATQDNSATTADGDFVFAEADLHFGIGETTKTFDVTVTGDTKYEQNESFKVVLSSASGAAIADGEGIGTISNDDSFPGISIDTFVIHEEGNSGTTTYAFNVSLSNPSYQQVEVTAESQDSSATTADADYVALPPTVITFAPGETQKSVTVDVNGDTKYEFDELFQVNLYNSSNAFVNSSPGFGYITNDDAEPTISIDDVTHNEGNAGLTSYTFTISLSNPSDQQVDVTAVSEDDSATTFDNDYIIQGPSTISFAAGETEKSFTASVVGDDKFEPDEQFKVSLFGEQNATISDETGVGTIQNDDSEPVASIDDVTHDEGNAGTTPYTFTISLSNPSYQQAEVNFIYSQDGTATTAGSAASGGADYQALAPTSVSFAPGETSKQVAVDVNGDTTFEPDEYFEVVISNPTNATMGDDIGTGTILNDDPTPTLAPNPFTVTHNEGNSGTTTYTFTIELDRTSQEQVDVTVETQDGNATTTDNDYQARGPETVSFAPGETQKQFDVTVNGDTNFEPDEVFTVQLTNSVNADIFHPTATGEITNDDVQPIQTTTFPAVADARVEQERSSSNFGSSTLLRVDNDDDVRSYLRFNLSGITGSIKSAKLIVYATEGTSNGPAVYKTNWTGSESSLTWNNKTSATSGATDDKGAIATGSYVQYDVKSLITGNTPHSFILRTSSSDGVDFASKEFSTASRRPVLEVTYGNDNQKPTPPTLSAQAASSTQVNLSWSGATDDFGVTGYKVYRHNVLRATLQNQTTYTDTALPGQTYVYEVSALDGAGNESATRSNAVTVKTPFTFIAVADARVEEANKSSNFGSSSTLRTVGGSGLDVETFLRFQVSGVSTISNVKLRLWVTNGTVNGPAAYRTTWTSSPSESSLTWNSRTPRTSIATDDKGALSSNAFVDFTVTPLVPGNGTRSFILATTSSDGADFSSRETSTSSRRPQLLITP